MENLRILLAVPTYNCEKQIRRVLFSLVQVKTHLPEIARVMVFDNQSTDATVTQAEAQVSLDQSAAWISIRRNRFNVGLGGTHKLAFEWARAEKASHLIVIHGDDQGEATEIPKIVDGLLQGFDAVLGSRFMTGSQRPGYSPLRIFGNRLLNAVYSLFTQTKIEDLGSGLNGFRVATLDPQVYKNFSNHFTFNMDLLLNLVESRARISFVPITWKEEDQISNAKTFLVGWQALKTLFYWRLSRKRSPLKT